MLELLWQYLWVRWLKTSFWDTETITGLGVQCSGVGFSQWLGDVLLSSIPKFKPFECPGITPFGGLGTCQMEDCLLTFWLSAYAVASGMEQKGVGKLSKCPQSLRKVEVQ